MKKVCVLGAGAWGTAIATVLARNGSIVKLWAYEKDLVKIIQETQENKIYLPDVILDENIKSVSSLEEAIDGVEWIFEAIPVPYLRTILQELKPHYKLFQRFVILSKGIEKESCALPTDIFHDLFGAEVDIVVIAGPSFARELCEKQLTGVVAASTDHDLIIELKELLENEYFKLFPSSDVRGVQVCSALKNIITLGIGMLDGAGCKDNTKSFFMVQSLHEIKQVMHLFKSIYTAQTLEGLAGIGDIVLTGFGKSSKNLAFGALIGKGLSIEQAQKEVRCIPEGISTIATVKQILDNYQLHMPILLALYACIYEKQPVSRLLDVLVCY